MEKGILGPHEGKELELMLLPASTVNGFDPKVEREIGRILGYR